MDSAIMTADEIRAMDIDELAEFILTLYDYDPIERNSMKLVVQAVAEEQGIGKQVAAYFKSLEKEIAKKEKQYVLRDDLTDFSMLDEQINNAGWEADDKGVRLQKANGETVWASSIPICPIEILWNESTKTEKVKLRFQKGNGRIMETITDKNSIASTNTIVKLANRGVEVTSENAKPLVKYLSDIINANAVKIPHHNAFSQLGWSAEGFIPYEDAVFDAEDNNIVIYNAIHSEGDFEEWKQTTAELRKNIYIRLMMDASFASVLIEKVSALPFIFHLWGMSGTGKTVALKIAMSIWGDPSMGKMVRTMNMTQNSMMSTAAFLHSIPFAGDELQTIKNRYENYDQLIMSIAEGIDRGRSDVTGNVREQKSWKCAFLFTGEEPCTKYNSGGGTKNRVIEVNLPNNLFTTAQGNEISSFADTHFGEAGRRFVEYIKDRDYTKQFRDISSVLREKADTTDKQANSMALIVLADQIVSEMMYNDKSLSLDTVAAFLRDSESVSQSNRAYLYLIDYLAKNTARFDGSDDNRGEFWGIYRDDHIMVNATVMKKILSDEGIEFDAIKKEWVADGKMEKFKHEYTIATSVAGKQARYAKIYLPEEEPKEVDEEDPLVEEF